MEDGAHTIFLSTNGENEDEVPKELVNFLKYVAAPLSESEKDFDDEFVERLQKAVKEVKISREMGARYMTFQELLSEERRAGREEGRKEAMKNVITQSLAAGNSLADISRILQIPLDEVKAIAEKNEN